MKIHQSSSPYVFHNLALEEHIIGHQFNDMPILLLYRNAPCVVIGKNQNPWREANVRALGLDRVPLARRASGGGAVYHDEGNLNFSFFVKREGYDQGAVYGVFIEALQSLGVCAERMGKSSVGVDGKKISGHAFAIKKGVAMHHGTLLVDTDRALMKKYLTPAGYEISTRAVASEPALVANLSEINPALTIDEYEEALIHAFGATGRIDPLDLSDLTHYFSNWDWCYGHTPKFEIDLSRGDESLELEVEKGLITTSSVSGPLEGMRFSSSEIAQGLRRQPQESKSEEFVNWIEEQRL